jgi:XRE family aerobic/anaerobic benzoate catabolism transcriptional regulator
VIAAGGSLVLEPLTYELLRERCLTIWLKASPEEHMDRVIAQGDLRPIRGRDHAMAELRTILKQRDRLYAMADAAVDTTGIGEAASLKRLVDVIAVASPLAGSSAREAPAAPG